MFPLELCLALTALGKSRVDAYDTYKKIARSSCNQQAGSASYGGQAGCGRLVRRLYSSSPYLRTNSFFAAVASTMYAKMMAARQGK